MHKRSGLRYLQGFIKKTQEKMTALFRLSMDKVRWKF